MNKKSEPWYVHAALITVILILTYILIRVAIVDPTKYLNEEKYYKTESHARMDDIKQAEILWEQKHKRFTDNLDSLITFIKTDTSIQQLIHGIDTITNRSTNPFTPLVSVGKFVPESLSHSAKTFRPYILEIDTSTSYDTVVSPRGKLLRVDTTVVMGTLYFVKDPDGYGTIGDTKNPALKNTSSWD